MGPVADGAIRNRSTSRILPTVNGAQEMHLFAVEPALGKQVPTGEVTGRTVLMPSTLEVDRSGEAHSTFPHSATCINPPIQQPLE